MLGDPPTNDQPLGALNVIGRSRMVEGFDLQGIVFVPLAGAAVQLGHAHPIISGRRGGALLQPLPQQFGKEMVVSIPAPLGIEGDDEQVGSLEILEGLLAGSRGVEQHGITQGAAQPI